MNNIVIIYRRYCEGTPYMNRLLAYAKGFAENGYHVRFYFLITQSDNNKVKQEIPNVEIIYLWESNCNYIRRLKLLSFFINLRRVRHLLKPSDYVLLYSPEVEFFFALYPIKRFNVFCEYTEHPDAYFVGVIHGIKKRIALSSLKKAKGIIAISNKLREYYVNNGLDASSLHISNMFVDASRFDGLTKDAFKTPYFAYCGIISKQKDGVDLLIKSFSIFRKTNDKYRLLIIGPFEYPKLEWELRSMCAEYGVDDSVVFTGKISTMDMPKLLLNAEVLLLTRPNNIQAQYGFPTKLGEYLATGNPILVTNVGEICDFIKDSFNGYIVEPDNIEIFANKLNNIVNNYEEAKAVGARGKQLVLSEFSAIEQSKRVLQFMKSRDND